MQARGVSEASRSHLYQMSNYVGGITLPTFWKSLSVSNLVAWLALSCGAVNAHPQANNRFIARSTIGVGAEFSDKSNHLLIGNAFNRRLAGLDIDYLLLLRENRIVRWQYDFEVRPIVFVQNPVSTTTDRVQFGSPPQTITTIVQDGQIPSRCVSSVDTNPTGIQPGVTTVETRTCGSRWTYGGGVSPLVNA